VEQVKHPLPRPETQVAEDSQMMCGSVLFAPREALVDRVGQRQAEVAAALGWVLSTETVEVAETLVDKLEMQATEHPQQLLDYS
jgi:hypothetical protein